MKKFFKCLGIILCVLWFIAITAAIVCAVMASVHNQPIKTEFLDWIQYVTKFFKYCWKSIKGWFGV